MCCRICVFPRFFHIFLDIYINFIVKRPFHVLLILYIFCIVISLVFDVVKLLGCVMGLHSPISLIYMYSLGKIDFDLCVSGFQGEFRNITPWINENQLYIYLYIYIHTHIRFVRKVSSYLQFKNMLLH